MHVVTGAMEIAVVFALAATQIIKVMIVAVVEEIVVAVAVMIVAVVVILGVKTDVGPGVVENVQDVMGVAEAAQGVAHHVVEAVKVAPVAKVVVIVAALILVIITVHLHVAAVVPDAMDVQVAAVELAQVTVSLVVNLAVPQTVVQGVVQVVARSVTEAVLHLAL